MEKKVVLAKAQKLLDDPQANIIDLKDCAAQLAEIEEFKLSRKLFARAMLKDPGAVVDDLTDLAEKLKNDLEFGVARKLLLKATHQEPGKVRLKQRLALCIYKDEELLPAKRFADALKVLEEIGLRDKDTRDTETLCLGGAVYKRMWEHGGQMEHLYESLFFYRAAHDRNPEQDLGYGGVNAAYILQILASRARAAARRSGTKDIEAQKYESQAAELRQAVIDELTRFLEGKPDLENENWFLVTLAEAYFGQQNYGEAANWLARSANLGNKVSEWERQTTFRQLVATARLQGKALPAEKSDPGTWDAPWQALRSLLEEGTEAALSCYRGKVGLALSGGGFRASLFHIGVLARLAEMDVLRSVEVLSTVSGGSIVGAHYYLEVQKLLEAKADGDITREDYVEIVKRLQKNFLNGIEYNLRTRTAANFIDNIKMIFSKTYSRTHRIGGLFENYIYSKVDDDHPQGRHRQMNDLLVAPQGAEGGFKPKFLNWRRKAKVPVLLLNATSLNSGHNWQFTASWMGEPPGVMGTEIDKNMRYRRLYYWEAPTAELQKFRLGNAVGASACVPVLFEPIAIEGLYPDKIVQLVDGGVHDNQGVAGLLDEGCTFILCSDASGQMDDKDKPSNGLLGVPMRTSSILMDRVREAQYQDLRDRLDSRSIQGLFFIHTKQELPVSPLDWVDCQDPSESAPKDRTKTSYGVDYDLQEKLSLIRTDLDSFTEVEASALMCSGYLMTRHEFQQLQDKHRKSGEPGTWGDFDVSAATRWEDWPFLDLKDLMKLPEQDPNPARRDLGLQLKVAAARAFKIWQLNPFLKYFKWVLAGAAALFMIWLIWRYWATPLGTVGKLILVLLPVLAGFISPLVKWVFTPDKASRSLIQKIGFALFGALAANIHIYIFDRMFISRGKLDRLLKKDPRISKNE